MIYNTRNRSKDTTKSQNEKKTCFNTHFQYSQSKITRLNKMWSLKSLAILKCGSRVYMQCNISDSQALLCCFVLINLRMASTDTLFLCSVGQQLWTCSQLVLIFFSQNQAFCFYKIVLIKRVYMSLLLSSSSNPTETMPRKFQGSSESTFRSSEKYRYLFSK